MITLSFMVNGQSLYRTDKNEVATDSLNAVEAEFTVDKEWDGTTKIAEFQNGDVLITSPVYTANPGNRLVAKVPAEVLANPGVLYVGLRGTKGTGTSAVRLTTVRRASVIVMSSTYAADYTPAEPHSLSEFEEMFQRYAAECTGAKISEISVNGVTITFTYADGTEKRATLDLSLFLRKSEASGTYQLLSNLSQIIPGERQSTTKYPSENAVATYVAEAVSDKADADSVYTKDETYSQEETDGLLMNVENNVKILYVAKDQGTANAGKYLVIAPNGLVTLINLPAPVWNNIEGKPDNFNPSAHNHNGADIIPDVSVPEESAYDDFDNLNAFAEQTIQIVDDLDKRAENVNYKLKNFVEPFQGSIQYYSAGAIWNAIGNVEAALAEIRGVS